MRKVRKACSVDPQWYPAERYFKNTELSEQFGYNCTAGP
jgi:hypothetical protein